MPATRASWLRVLLIQGGVGLAWLLASPHRTDGRAYLPAIRLGRALDAPCYPIRLWGLLLIVIALGLTWTLRRAPARARGWSVALSSFWTFWLTLFAAAIPTGGSFVPPLLAGGFAWYAFDHARRPEAT